MQRESERDERAKLANQDLLARVRKLQSAVLALEGGAQRNAPESRAPQTRGGKAPFPRGIGAGSRCGAAFSYASSAIR
jgi:hypothetical protein